MDYYSEAAMRGTSLSPLRLVWLTFLRTLRRAADAARDNFALIKGLRVQLLVGLVGGLAFAFLPQSQELFRMAVSGPDGLVALLPLQLGACFLGLVLGTMGTQALSHTKTSRARRIARSLWTIATAHLVPAGILFGLLLARREMGFDGIEALVDVEDVYMGAAELAALPEVKALRDALVEMRGQLATSAATMAVMMLATMALVDLLQPALRRDKHSIISHAMAGVVVVSGIVAVWAFGKYPTQSARVLDASEIVVLALLVMGVVLTYLSWLSNWLRLPLLSLATIGLVIFLATNENGSHDIQVVESDDYQLMRADEAFGQWIEDRADRGVYEEANLPYPVFIIAASGGGAYAAQYAATVLARIQDRCPRFAQHVFAISGVSGGALGGTLFSNVAQERAKNSDEPIGCLETSGNLFADISRKFFEHDTLSPLVGGLYADLAQAFSMEKLWEKDRAGAFEAGLSDAWSTALPDSSNTWDKPLRSSWQSDGAAPALMLNATDVATSYRVVMGPFQLVDPIDDDIPNTGSVDLPELVRGNCREGKYNTIVDVPLATAVSLSSRFPWIFPVGVVETCTSRARLVDGGYADNSGLVTAMDLVNSLVWNWLGAGEDRPNIPIALHVISIGSHASAETNSSTFVDFISSPFQTLLGGLSSRPEIAEGAFTRLNAECELNIVNKCEGITRHKFVLDRTDFELPLGFALAPTSQMIMDLMAGAFEREQYVQGSAYADSSVGRIAGYVELNDAAAGSVMSALGEPQPGGRYHPVCSVEATSAAGGDEDAFELNGMPDPELLSLVAETMKSLASKAEWTGNTDCSSRLATCFQNGPPSDLVEGIRRRVAGEYWLRHRAPSELLFDAIFSIC